MPKHLQDKEANQEKDLGDNDEHLGDEEENLGDEEENLEDANFGDEDASFEDEEETPEDETLYEEEPTKGEDPNSTGPSILDNMEISMVHVLPADFQSTTSQPSFLDGDVVAKEATQVDFVSLTDLASN